MKRISFILIAIVSALFTSVPRVHGQGTTCLYQGVLRDTNGPVNGTATMLFRLYAAPSGGSPLWEETHLSIPVTNGLFAATVDADGVALAAIQGLNQKLDSECARLRDELKRRDAENTELQARPTKLEELISELRSKGN